jgi:alpha-mannosidase
MHDDRSLIEQRLQRTLEERLRPAVYGPRCDLAISAWEPPHAGPTTPPVPAEVALAAPYRPCGPGHRWGRPWSTTWFRFDGVVPEGWPAGAVEAAIDLGFAPDRAGFSCEGLAYAGDATVLKALSPRNHHVVLHAGPGEAVTLFVEAAANPDIGASFRPTLLGDPATAGDALLYRLGPVELAVRCQPVWDLVLDTEVLAGLIAELGLDDPRRHLITRALERMLDRLDLGDIAGTAAPAAKELAEVLAQPAVPSAHRVSAVGHAHIDSAWLWPLRETQRKVARTVANVLALAETDPGYVFAFSQAQQLAWLQQDHPALFERVKQRVRTGQIVPVGGLWVEPDGNLPGGEAMARQLIYGKRYFSEQLGVETEEVWMPDSFGYSAALPQLMRLAGNRWMLTQKLSWNETNQFPHHTFWWEGIDGTRLFTHFPPVDTYNAEMTPAELGHASRTFRDHGRATRSLVPFGYGDGGGGPTREMLGRIRRQADLEGSPMVVIEAPREFFERAEAEYPDAPVWSGELYLELHRGTLTTQARSKAANRQSEHLLHEAELWATTAWLRAGRPYPYDELERLWKLVLLLQFHDILPGTSIAWVYRDSERIYAEVTAALEAEISAALAALGGPNLQFNSAPYARRGVPAMGAAVADTSAALGARPVTVEQMDGILVVDNGLIRVTVDATGSITSIEDRVAGRQVLAPGTVGNLLQLHPDFPSQYDAWDVDRSYRNTHVDLLGVDELIVVDDGPLLGALRVARAFGSSRVTQTLRVEAGAKALIIETDIDWQETERFLKAAFPLDVHADRVASEIAFGHVFRPTHTNTSWDAARFEVSAHRWIQVGEPGYGVAVTTTATYGHDVARHTRDDGGTTTTLRLSLLRAPRYPDPQADRGRHHFTYVVHPGASIADAVAAGYHTNLPLRAGADAPAPTHGPAPASRQGVEPLVASGSDAVVVETVKASDDRRGAVVIRLYEAWGSHATTVLTARFPWAEVVETDLLERPVERASGAVGARRGQEVDLRLRPFQILTLRLQPAAHPADRGADRPGGDLSAP